MQLGTRWRVGEAPPSRLPEVVKDAVSRIEAALPRTDADGWRWTLTWLEGLPIAELDDGTRVTVDRASGNAVVGAADDEHDPDE